MEKEKIIEIIKKDNVKFLKLIFVDLLGVTKTIEVSVNELDTALNNKIMIDGSNIIGLSSVNSADMFLSPDLSSFKRVPFYDCEFGNVAVFMCDVLTPGGDVASGCTRSNLKTELAKLKAQGFTKMNIGFEPEFFLFKNKPTGKIQEGDFVDLGRHYADGSRDETAMVRRELMNELEKIGISCQSSHHESAISQYEVTYKYSDALTACDNVLLVKLLVKEIAKKHGLFATFMPKPSSLLAGNGLHTNVSFSKENKNVFAGANGNEISDIAEFFIAGIIKHARGLSFLTNPTINSYKRLVHGYEAPVNICWGEANRTAMIRIPLSKGNACRVEIRNVDAASNPYLAVAGILAAGLDGINGKLLPPPAINTDVYKLIQSENNKQKPEQLPANLEEAMKEFIKDKVLFNAAAPHISELLVDIKKKEIETYNRAVNSFDFEYYF